MQQQRRVYAQHNPGAVDVLPVVQSDNSVIVDFLLRALPTQTQWMSTLRENIETIEVEVDLMERNDQD